MENQFGPEQIFPDVRAHELYAAAAEDLNERIQLFFEGRLAQRDVLRDNFPDTQLLVVPPSNPFYVNPFADAPYTLLAYSFGRDYGPTIFAAASQVYVGTAGATLQLSGTWQLTLSETYGRQSLRSDEYNLPDPGALAASLADPNPTTAFDPFGDGSNTNAATLAAIRRDYLLHAISSTEFTRLVAAGSLLRMPGGDAKLAAGVERGEGALFHDVANPLNPTEETIPQRYARKITSIFSELALPLCGKLSHSRALSRLELDLAGRYDRYSDFGHTFNPTARIHLIPADIVKLRASWGRSFRAPTLDDLYDTSSNESGEVVLPDPSSSTGRSLVLAEVGSNPHLKEETAKTWTAGFDLAPKILAGATFSLTYYSIDYANRITQPAADNSFAILVNAAEWGPEITRNPGQAQIAAVCHRPDYVGSVPECLASSPSAVVDYRLANLTTTHTTGLDVEAHDSLSGAWGSYDLAVTGNYVFEFDQAVTPSFPPLDIVNTVSNPFGLRLRGTVGWSTAGARSRGPGLDLTVNYTGGYRNPGSTLMPHISPWATIDARIVYRTRRTNGWLTGMELAVNAVNVFNHDPPFTDVPNGYDLVNVQPLGRVVSVSVSKEW